MIWTRRRFMQRSSVALAATTLTDLGLWAQDASGTFRTLRRNVGIFSMRGGTIGWLVSDDGLVVVDSQYPDTAQACLAGLRERSARQIDALINTHHHGDHTGGNAVLRSATTQIVAHVSVPEWQKRVAVERETESDQAYADVTFDAEWELDLGSEVVSAKHYGPGHTSGDVAVTFQRANIVHMGDLMFNRRHPRVDRPAGASVAGWMELLTQVTADHARDTTYVFGHAGEGFPVTGSRDQLAYQADYFEAVLEHARKGIASGQSRDEVMRAESLPGFTSHAGGAERLGRVLGDAFDELTSGVGGRGSGVGDRGSGSEQAAGSGMRHQPSPDITPVPDPRARIPDP